MPLSNKKLIFIYVYEFGLPSIQTRQYPHKIISYYIQNNCKPDYDQYIAMTCEPHEIKAESMKTLFRRTLKASWNKPSAVEAWERRTGWREQSPPGTAKAIRFMCENFPGFAQEWEKSVE